MKPLVAIAALLALAGCSSAEPAEPATETVTATETQAVEYVPQPCTDALMHADDALQQAADLISDVADGYESAASRDAAGVRDTQDKIDAATPEIAETMNLYRTMRDRCEDEA